MTAPGPPGGLSGGVPWATSPTMAAVYDLANQGFALPPGLMANPGLGGSPLSGGVGVPGMTAYGGGAAADAVAQQAAQSVVALVNQLKITTGAIERDMRAIRQHSLDAARGATGGQAPSGASAPPPDSPEARGGTADPAKDVTPVRAPAGVPEGGEPRRQGRREFSLGDVGREAAAHAARALSQSTSRYELRDDGKWVPAGGRRIFEGEPEPVGFARQRALGVATQASKAAGQIAQGASLTEALPALGMIAGPATLIAGAGIKTAQFLEGQRQANVGYQQITGGPNFSLTDPSSGFRQRLGENAFRYSQMGVMGGDQARQLYMGVTATGLQGGERKDALDLATEQFRKTGMDVSDSIKLIDMTVRSGVTTFGTLNTALDQVSQTAKQTGQNVQESQRRYAQQLGVVQNQVTDTASAATITAGMQTELDRQGRTLSGQLDFTGLTTQQSTMLQAASLGQTPSQYGAAIQNDPGLLGKGMQTSLDRVRDAVFGAEGIKWANAQAQKMTAQTGGKLTPGDAAELGRQMAAKGYLNVQQFMVVAAQMGLGGVTPANVYETAAKIAVGGIRLDQSLAQSSSVLADGGRTIGGQSIVTAADKASTPDYDAKTGQQGKMIAQAIGAGGTNDLSKQGVEYLREVQGRFDAHGKVSESGTGQRSAIVEGLLKDQKAYSDKHFRVQTGDGEKTVDFKTAFSKYRDQLERGDVVVQETGDTVSTAVGAPGDRTNALDSAGKPAAKGAKAGDAPAGSVGIYASPELERILRFTYGGSTYADSARRSGVPASAFPQAPSQYPTAGGN